MEEAVHLHQDYSTSFCGEDAAHIPMTHALEDTTCGKCREALAERRKTFETVLSEHETNHTTLEAAQSELAEKNKALMEELQRVEATRQELAQKIGVSFSKKAELETTLQSLPA